MRTLLLLPLLGSCAHSGLGHTDETTGGTGSTGDTGPTSVENCPWVGTWNLVAIRCNTFPYDDWYDTHTGATMAIDHAPAGGCAVSATISGPACTRTEAWTFTVPVGTSVDVDHTGITSCDPDQCTWDPTDAPCTPGGLATGVETLTIDDSSGSLTAVGLIRDTAAGCTLDVITTWGQ